MMKYYFLGLTALLAAVAFGLDRYMTSKKLLWSAVAEVWPFWLLMLAIGSIVGGYLLGLVAQFIFNQKKQTLEAKLKTDKEAYQHFVDDSFKRRETTLAQLENTLNEKIQEAESSIKAHDQSRKIVNRRAETLKADAERLALETKAENERLKKAAFNATKVVERIRRKHERDLVKLRGET